MILECNVCYVFQFDQVPLPFVLDRTTTYEVGDLDRYEKVTVSTPGSGLDKRQATLQLCFSPEDNQVRPAVIFRGKHGGKFINKTEKQYYDKDVDVYFQPNAWADTEFSVDWIERTLKPATQVSDSEFLLFCDNLSCQVKDEFKVAIRNINGIVWYGLNKATDLWQPVDAGFGRLMKQKIREACDEWLMEEENMDLWLGNSGENLGVSRRRVILTGKANQISVHITSLSILKNQSMGQQSSYIGIVISGSLYRDRYIGIVISSNLITSHKVLNLKIFFYRVDRRSLEETSTSRL